MCLGCSGQVRFEAEGFLKLGDGALILADGVKRNTQVVVRLGQVRFEPQGFPTLCWLSSSTRGRPSS
jgi:hypothetical protein